MRQWNSATFQFKIFNTYLKTENYRIEFFKFQLSTPGHPNKSQYARLPILGSSFCSSFLIWSYLLGFLTQEIEPEIHWLDFNWNTCEEPINQENPNCQPTGKTCSEDFLYPLAREWSGNFMNRSVKNGQLLYSKMWHHFAECIALWRIANMFIILPLFCHQCNLNFKTVIRGPKDFKNLPPLAPNKIFIKTLPNTHKKDKRFFVRNCSSNHWKKIQSDCIS